MIMAQYTRYDTQWQDVLGEGMFFKISLRECAVVTNYYAHLENEKVFSVLNLILAWIKDMPFSFVLSFGR